MISIADYFHFQFIDGNVYLFCEWLDDYKLLSTDSDEVLAVLLFVLRFMQNPRRKRRRRGDVPSDVASTSCSSFDAGGQTPLQSLRRASMLHSSMRRGVSSDSSASVERVATLENPSDVHSKAVLSPEYMDLGRCDEICEFCGAFFWRGERLASFPASSRPRYHKCCRAGKVAIDYPVDPPLN